MKIYRVSLFAAICGYFVLAMPTVLAQTASETTPSSQSMEVQRIGLADLNGILRRRMPMLKCANFSHTEAKIPRRI